MPAADVFSKFEKSAWGQKLSARVSKETTTDFQRYQWAKAKVKRSRAVTAELKKLSGGDSTPKRVTARAASKKSPKKATKPADE